MYHVAVAGDAVSTKRAVTKTVTTVTKMKVWQFYNFINLNNSLNPHTNKIGK